MSTHLRLRKEEPDPARLDVIPFNTGASAQCSAASWRPRTNWNPANPDCDAAQEAEHALDHIDRQMHNLRALLGMTQETNNQGPRAA